MRCVSHAAVAVIVLLAVQIPGKAQAQGFFQNLFGGFNAQPSYPQEPRRVLQSPYGYRTPSSAPSRFRERNDERSDERSQSQDGTGNYRTLCVRMCDGYYWPISYATRRSGFYHDANVCRASCGEEARLFFHGSRDRDTKEMVDISGRNYTKLPTAYLYRKTQVEGCKCKPEPWTQTELDRHRMYALNEADNARRRQEQLAIDEQIAAEKAAQVAAEKAAKAEAVAAVKRILAGKSANPQRSPVIEVAAVEPAQGETQDNVTYVRKAGRPAPGPDAGPAPAVARSIPPTSDPAVAAALTAGLQPAAPFAATTPDVTAETAPIPPKETAEPAAVKRAFAAEVPRPERRPPGARQAASQQGASQQGASQQGRARPVQARAQATKPSGGFGLGAGSKSMRWPGE